MRTKNTVVGIKGAESKGEAAEFGKRVEPKRPHWQLLLLWALYALAVCFAVVLLATKALADIAFELDLRGPEEVSSEFTLIGQLTNTGTDTLGVIGGLKGEPAGYDYEVGAQAFVSEGYGFTWAPDFNAQFDGVNLLPGESFKFDFALISAIDVNDSDTYRSWLELQLYPAPRPSDMLAKERVEISWTTAGFIGTTQPDADNPPPDIRGDEIAGEAGQVAAVVESGGGAALWLLLLALVGRRR